MPTRTSPARLRAFRVTSDTVIFICVGSEVEMARAMTHATGDTLTARFGTSGGKRVFQSQDDRGRRDHDGP